MILIEIDQTSLECLNFCLATHEDSYIVEIDNEHVQAVMRQIEDAVAAGKTYINVKDSDLTYVGRYYNEQIIEIQWG